MLVPPWLESLLSIDFFFVCSAHKNASRSECNIFCLDCQNDAFCSYCRTTSHKDHHVIQIRRSSYHDVVKVNEIEKLLDITGVQTYVINSARVLFLNERPQPKSTGKGSSHLCEICRRALLESFRFCSLGCKLVGINKNGDSSFVLSTKDDEIAERRERMARRLPAKEEENMHEGIQESISRSTPPPPHSNSRRRKGIPRRAPLGT